MVIRVWVFAVIGLAIIGIAAALWFSTGTSRNAAVVPPAVPTARQYDTTGGEEMRPQWGSDGGGEHANDR